MDRGTPAAVWTTILILAAGAVLGVAGCAQSQPELVTGPVVAPPPVATTPTAAPAVAAAKVEPAPAPVAKPAPAPVQPKADSAPPVSAPASPPAAATKTEAPPSAVAPEPKKENPVEAKGYWLDSLDQGKKVAKEQGKFLFIDFTAGWCQYCKMMDSGTYPDAAVRKSLENYVRVRIDTDKEKDLAEQYNIDGLPTMIVADASGKVLARVASYLPPKSMLEFLGDVSTYLAAKEKLAKDAKNLEAAFTVADKSMSMELSNEERLKLVGSALELMPPTDGARRAKLLHPRGYLTAMGDNAKMDEAIKDFEAAAAVDPKNQAGVNEEATWVLLQARYRETRNADDLEKGLVAYLAAHPRDQMKNGDIRNQAFGLQYRLATDREDFAAAVKALETIKAENKDLPTMDQLDAAIAQTREQLKAKDEEAKAASVKSGQPAPKAAAPDTTKQ
jgi:thioredoxin-related protein